MGEKILYGLQVSLIGLGFIFGILALLIGFIYLFSYLLNLKNKAPAKLKDGKTDPKIIAAITASINSFYETNAEKGESKSIDFIVKSIKRR